MSEKINLHSHEIQKLERTRMGSEIRCLDGLLWLTQDGDINDHILANGEKFVIARKGKIVVQALEPSSFSLN